MDCLPLYALSRVVEEFVKSGTLTLLDGVLVEQLVRVHRRVRRLDPALHQDVLRVQHLRHAQTVSEPLVHCGQRVLYACARFQALRLELRTSELQGLREELERAHVEQKLLQPSLEWAVLTFSTTGPCRFSQSAQRCRLRPGHRDDRVDQHGDEPELGKHFVVLRRQKRLFRELRRWGKARVLVLLVQVACWASSSVRSGEEALDSGGAGVLRIVQHHALTTHPAGGNHRQWVVVLSAGDHHVVPLHVVPAHVVHLQLPADALRRHGGSPLEGGWVGRRETSGISRMP